MSKKRNIEKLIRVRKPRATTGDCMDEMILNDAFAAMDKVIQFERTGTEMSIGRKILGNPITKLAAAAVIVLGVVLGIKVLMNDLARPVYALEQTIEASQGIECLNFKCYGKYDPCSSNEAAKNAWILRDANGVVKKIRVDLYGKWDDKLVEVWDEGKFLVWHKCKDRRADNCKNALEIIYESDDMTAMMLRFAEKHDPRQAIEHLYKMQKEGKATIEIQESSNKDEPIIITGRYLPGEYLTNDQNMQEITDVLFVDPGTKLVIKKEVYMDVNGQTEYRGVYKDFNYMPFDLNVFDIEKEVPDNVLRMVHYNPDDVNDLGVDVNTLLVKTGNRADKMAIEITRQFFDALIAKNYKQAGQIFGGMPADEAEIKLGGYNVVRVVSIGEDLAVDEKNNFSYVPCVVEIEENGIVSRLEAKVFAIGPVNQSGSRRMKIVNIIW